MASSPSSLELPVFIDTNLGTHLAMAVSPDITAGDLKSKFVKEHYICVPNLGEIRAHALMVKCNSCFYHIPDSVPIKNFIQGLNQAWFLQLDATFIENMQNQVAPMTNTIITKEGNNPGKPCVASAGGIQQFPRQGSLVGSECFRLTPNSLHSSGYCGKIIIPNPSSKESRELNRMPSPHDDEYLGGRLSDSTSNVNYVVDCPKLGNHVTFEGKRNDNDDSKRHNEQFMCPEYQPEELLTSIKGPRRKGRLNKKCNSKDVADGSPEDVKMKIHPSLGGYSNDENLLFDNSCKQHASDFEETQQGKVDSDNGEDDRNATLRTKFIKKANCCKDIHSRCKIAFTEERSKDEHRNRGLESNATDANVDGHKLVSLKNSFPHITQKDQGASLSQQAQGDRLASINEAMGGEGVTSPSVSEIISVTGIITRYFFEFDEVTSETKSLRNTTDCSNKTNDSGMPKREDTCQPFIASNVEESKSKTTTSKKFRKHKVLPSAGMEEKGRNSMSHDITDEHGVNQGHRDVCIKADATTQAAVKSPPIQFSVRWSASPITETPRSKPERSEVGKRFLLAANGLGISTSKQKPKTKCCSRVTKSSLHNSFAFGKNLFDISNFDD
ncbi:hypothetical protein CKAN_01378800 [Cinnamomum micranthum f. kanehirae]|uniref:Uncharacterized protein n=1 Tax=Cinnamomum micranthum f. kanehirae TaxID=337451 RepID=A0A3S4P2U8_9MAGN|nr:hypothetical protein CKAN_01378800 [Cinnamomum micranthum f. kanehirae]